jgi:ectoine hydroxylase-related dioxygenase (phytanoyl-CoA dioxygenase family)
MWAHHETITGAVRDLLHDDPLLAKTIVYFKPPGSPGVALHQDEQFFPLRPIVSVVIALDSCDEANGRLVVLPRTHREGLLPLEPADLSESIVAYQSAVSAGAQEVGLDMAPGDALFMNGALVHGSHPNRSIERFRRSLLCIFTSQHAATFSDLLARLAERAAAASR